MVKDLEYYRLNCEENYIKTPISVLRYIKELENKNESAHELLEALIDSQKFLCELGTNESGLAYGKAMNIIDKATA